MTVDLAHGMGFRSLKRNFNARTMGKNKSHRDWIHRHLNDPYVQEATRAGYRSRGGVPNYSRSTTRISCCAADSACSTWVRRRGRGRRWRASAWERTGRVFALDLLPMAPIPGVDFLQGDFTEEATERALEALLAGAVLDVVLGDMATQPLGYCLGRSGACNASGGTRARFRRAPPAP